MQIAHAPAQERSVRSLARLLDAAERLMRDRDFDDISIAEIVKEAGTSVGNFYGRFESKDALLDALHERYQSDRAQLWRAFFDREREAPRSLEQRVHSLVSASIANFRDRSGVFRSLVAKQWRNPASLDKRGREALANLYEEAAAFLLECKQEMRCPNPKLAVEIGMATVLAACREHVVLRPQNMPASLKIADETLGREVAQMFHAYLTAGSGRKAGRIK